MRVRTDAFSGGLTRPPVQRTSSRERPGQTPGRFALARASYSASSSTRAKQAITTRLASARLSTPTQASEVAPLVARVTALQDHLGFLHDADVAAAMARTFLVEQGGGLSAVESAAIGRYLVSREREVARLRRTVGTAWRGVAGIGFRRGLGRAVAGL